MEIISLTKDHYNEWDTFCLQSEDTWFWHTSSWLEYTLHYKLELSPRSASFFVTHEGKIVGTCLLIIETYEDGAHEFSFGGIHTPAPALAPDLSSHMRERVLKLIFEEVDNRAKQYKISRVKFRFPVLNTSFLKSPFPPFNFLLKYEYLDTSINTQIIDLSRDTLWRDVRHGHQYDINQGKKNFQFNFYDAETITPEIFDQYVTLHRLDAGRTTRPPQTFKMMKQWITEGKALLGMVRKDTKPVAYAYIFLYKNAAYYGSGCLHPEYVNSSASHFLQWSIIEYLKKNGVNFYEIGWQKYGNILSSNFDDPKELQISKFKRGFGGVSVPLFRGEKFYDKEYFLKIYEGRMKGYYAWLGKKKSDE